MRKSDIFRESDQKRSKELIPKRKQKELRVITLQGAIEKIISHFGGSNNILGFINNKYSMLTHYI